MPKFVILSDDHIIMMLIGRLFTVYLRGREVSIVNGQ